MEHGPDMQTLAFSECGENGFIEQKSKRERIRFTIWSEEPAAGVGSPLFFHGKNRAMEFPPTGE